MERHLTIFIRCEEMKMDTYCLEHGVEEDNTT